jgi:hypothetical protein
MTDRQALDFIKKYFRDLFVARNVNALDIYLHPEYTDDDIGSGEQDWLGNSKRFLEELFQRRPTINVTVHKAMINNEVIAADLEWFERLSGEKRVWQRGIGIFKLKDEKIVKRHTFIYFANDGFQT